MMQRYLHASRIINFDDPCVARQALALAQETNSELERVKRCFEFVRDEIKHSWDYQLNPVTCRASDVLRHKTGYCYAKSHLLAALLRALGIPAGFCYQRLSVGESGPPFCLHGLNVVFLEDFGWYRMDARGNKPGVAAEFCPPYEKLAFALHSPEECDLPEIWPEPLPAVTQVLEAYDDVARVYANLPDIVTPAEYEIICQN